MAAKFKPDQDLYKTILGEEIYIGTIHPQEGFINGFLKPLLNNPRNGLRSIIDYDPSEGQVFFKG